MSNMRARTKHVVIGLAAAVAGFVIAGGAVAMATGALTNENPVTIHQLSGPSQSSARAWPTNASGQTDGSLLNSTSSATEPVLAQVIATNGKVGFVYSKELDGVAPSSPAQALAEQAVATAPQFIPVYLDDGTTMIGQFAVSEPSADVPTTTGASSSAR
jgi:hypothetical protein